MNIESTKRALLRPFAFPLSCLSGKALEALLMSVLMTDVIGVPKATKTPGFITFIGHPPLTSQSFGWGCD